MRASSWASTTTRRARSVNRSNMLIAPENRGPSRPAAFRGYGVLTVLTAYAFPCRTHGGPLRANRPVTRSASPPRQRGEDGPHGGTDGEHMRDSDRQDFEQFARARTPELMRAAWLLCGERYAAEDLVQDTLARLFSRWGRVRRADNPVAYARTVLTRL